MINQSVPPFPAQPISWSGIARLCRRICLLRECGRADEAEQLRCTALAEALADVRAGGASDAEIEPQLQGIIAVEAERVANAAVLAELLANFLAGQNPSVHPQRSALEDAASPAAPAPVRVAQPPAEASVPAAKRSDPGDISHFIDEMLTQERPNRRAS